MELPPASRAQGAGEGAGRLRSRLPRRRNEPLPRSSPMRMAAPSSAHACSAANAVHRDGWRASAAFGLPHHQVLLCIGRAFCAFRGARFAV